MGKSGKYDPACLTFNGIVMNAAKLARVCDEYLEHYACRTDAAVVEACEEVRLLEAFIRVQINRLAGTLPPEAEILAIARLPGRIADYLN